MRGVAILISTCFYFLGLILAVRMFRSPEKFLQYRGQLLLLDDEETACMWIRILGVIAMIMFLLIPLGLLWLWHIGHIDS